MVSGNFSGKPVQDELKNIHTELNDTDFSSQQDSAEH
jgi:hypothetical protein